MHKSKSINGLGPILALLIPSLKGKIRGVSIDIALVPFITALWNSGVVSFQCCQGGSNGQIVLTHNLMKKYPRIHGVLGDILCKEEARDFGILKEDMQKYIEPGYIIILKKDFLLVETLMKKFKMTLLSKKSGTNEYEPLMYLEERMSDKEVDAANKSLPDKAFMYITFTPVK